MYQYHQYIELCRSELTVLALVFDKHEEKKTYGSPWNGVIQTRLIELDMLITLPSRSFPKLLPLSSCWYRGLCGTISSSTDSHPSQNPAEHPFAAACSAHLLLAHTFCTPRQKHSQWQKHRANSTFFTLHLSIDVQQEKLLPFLFEELLTRPPFVHLDHKSASPEPLLWC